jgi:WD40 repeat protein
LYPDHFRRFDSRHGGVYQAGLAQTRQPVSEECLQPSALLGHAGRVGGISLSADGHLVASGGDDATVRLWDAARRRLLVILKGHAGAVWRVAISADGQLVASGGSDGTVRVWNASLAWLLKGFPGAHRRSLGCGAVR